MLWLEAFLEGPRLAVPSDASLQTVSHLESLSGCQIQCYCIMLLSMFSQNRFILTMICCRTSSNTSDVRMLVFDSIVDIFFFIDIIFNFHTSFVGNNGEVITEETVIRRHYLKVIKQFILWSRSFLIFHPFQSGFIIDIMACLPYDLLNTFIGTSHTDIFSILKVGGGGILHKFIINSYMETSL